MRTSKVAIIGCGAIGITTALKIQEKLRNGVQVTIFSKDFSPNLTSDIAAGLWEPYLLEMTSEEKTTHWASETYQYLIANWEKAESLGIMLQPVTYITDTEPFATPSWLETTLGYLELPERQIEQFSKQYQQKLTRGFHFVSFIWEASKFIPHFTKIFLDNGGTIIKKNIQDLWELSEYDVVVNCSGLGSKDIVRDIEVKPIRGQVMKVKAPWQNQVYIIDCNSKCSYIIPNVELTTLGGTKQIDYNTKISDVDTQHIKITCESIVPSLKTAEIVREVVGLRPSRSKVRVEAEIVQWQDKHLKVVHNYGHGGAGITLSIGCAKEAADLVGMLLMYNKMKLSNVNEIGLFFGRKLRINLSDLKVNVPYPILKAKLVNGPYGEVVLVGLGNNVVFLPKRATYELKKPLDNFNPEKYTLMYNTVMRDIGKPYLLTQFKIDKLL